MKRPLSFLAVVALGTFLAAPPAFPQACAIGGHNETSENFAPGGWAITNMSPGTVAGPPAASHLVISEVAPRGAGTGAASDSSEYIEIYNPTPRPISLSQVYLSDDNNYYRIVNGTYLVTNASDFTLRFPTGLTIDPARTTVICVTKAGMAGSGAVVIGAQHFLEMQDSNGNPADDMIIMTPNSSFLPTGGSLTNPSATNGEWVVLFCWNGASDLVCDIDYASWGANAASNPKLDKTLVTIDGPDAGAVASAYNPDTPAGVQSNLGSGTVLTKPNTYHRVAGEVGEVVSGGNGCRGRVVPNVIDWVPVPGTGSIRFQVRWENQDDDYPSDPINGTIRSQEFGVFLPDYGDIGSFSVPPLQPSSFFDVFVDIPLTSLPPKPQKIVPGGGGGGLVKTAEYGQATMAPASDCPPDTNWAGNVDIQWSGPGQGGQVNKHYADLLTCRGGAPSFIHVRPSNCPAAMPWSIVGVCPGFTVALVNEDFSPAPNPVPVGWSGWISVSAAAAVPTGTTCCFGIVFQCQGATSTIDICSTACDCQNSPILGTVDWTNIGSIVRFHARFDNPSASPTDPISGNMNSQAFGVFMPDYGQIGTFNVPPIQPNSFFDIFVDIAANSLPPEPAKQVGSGGPSVPCPPPGRWNGNVDIEWGQPGQTTGQANYHFGDLAICPGPEPSYLHLITACTVAPGATWAINGLCPGFTATLVNEDHSPAPNPLPPGWTGWIAVQAAAGTPVGTVCCFTVDFVCGGVPGQIRVCARVCDCHEIRPVLSTIDWTRIGTNVRFHLNWRNDDAGPSEPVNGNIKSQPFGVFMPDFGDIGSFDVPPIQPHSFFDVFVEVPLTELPPEPQEVLPGGGPGPGSPCPPDTSWSGNVDIQWSNSSGTGGGQTNYHFTSLLVRPGTGSSHVHTLIFCNSAAGATWSITGLCPGWSATLLNENFTPAPNPVPPGWTGWISVAAAAGVPPGSHCCFSVTFVCDGVPGTIDVCAEACVWANTSVDPQGGMGFGIMKAVPNPTADAMSIDFAVPRAAFATVEVYDLNGKRVGTLFSRMAEAGTHTIRWNGRDRSGHLLPTGAYFLRLEADHRVGTKRVVLIR